MFKRIFHEDWATWIPIISFICIFAFFLVATLRALVLGKERREHLAWLPITSSDENPETPNSSQKPS